MGSRLLLSLLLLLLWEKWLRLWLLLLSLLLLVLGCWIWNHSVVPLETFPCAQDACSLKVGGSVYSPKVRSGHRGVAVIQELRQDVVVFLHRLWLAAGGS